MPTPVPPPATTVPDTPDRSDRATFNARAINIFDYIKNVMWVELTAYIANAYANAVDALASAVIAQNAAAAAGAASGAPKWVAGSYATDAPAYSPINGLVYRRLAPGGATTLDPSTDPTNWSTIIVGDVTVGGVQTLTNKTLTGAYLNDPIITNYKEAVHAPSAGTAFTVNLANGTMQKFTTSGNCTITLPAAVAGRSYTIVVAFGGTHTLTFAGGTALKWAGGTAPTPTSVNGKEDWYTFSCADTASTRGADAGRNF